jgi:hypothetical protein
LFDLLFLTGFEGFFVLFLLEGNTALGFAVATAGLVTGLVAGAVTDFVGTVAVLTGIAAGFVLTGSSGAASAGRGMVFTERSSKRCLAKAESIKAFSVPLFTATT